MIEGHRSKLIEVKLSDDQPSKSFSAFENVASNLDKIQLVAKLDRRYDSKNGVAVENGPRFLAQLDLLKKEPKKKG